MRSVRVLGPTVRPWRPRGYRRQGILRTGEARLCVPHASVSDLLTAASLHLNAFLRRSVFVEFNVTSGPLSREPCRTPIRMREGYVDVPQGPGLGVEVDGNALRKYRALF